jgi:hypothetical protein
MNRRLFKMILPVLLSVMLLVIVLTVIPARSASRHLGYGFNVAAWDTQRLSDMDFNWIKIFDAPQTPLPQYVLLRVDVISTTTAAELQADIAAKLVYSNNITAWEIGNEPNIDASYGWAGPPDASAYKTRLCAAYAQIKAADPDAIVVSAGLAPTGRITGNFGGHPGHNGSAQDDRQFLIELLDNGGGACLDAVGYHPYGYSAGYNAAPDVASADPAQNCANGFCFRGTEKIYEIMQQQGLGDKRVWATEFGWITRPPDQCLSDPSWAGREYQIVTDEKQASNLVGAFQYADAHWPWMGAMFIFNLNFDNDPLITNPCEQMRFYSVQGRPAETALTDMVKNPTPAILTGRLQTDVNQLSYLIGVDEQPVTLTGNIFLSNWGWQPANYTGTAKTDAAVVPLLFNPTGTLTITSPSIALNITSTNRATGVYTGQITVNWSAGGVSNPPPRNVLINLLVVSDVQRIYLPAMIR